MRIYLLVAASVRGNIPVRDTQKKNSYRSIIQPFKHRIASFENEADFVQPPDVPKLVFVLQ